VGIGSCQNVSSSIVLDSDHLPNGDGKGSHSVQFYEEEEALIEHFNEFIGSALGAGHFCIALRLQNIGSGFQQRQIFISI
jgi:hypothetical protein